MRQWKLKSCRRQRHLVTVANRFDSAHACNDRGRCGLVIEMQRKTAASSGRQYSRIIRTAYDDGCSPSRASRKQLVQRILFEQRIAPGQKHDVKIELAQHIETNFDFIDADAHGTDGAVGSQLR